MYVQQTIVYTYPSGNLTQLQKITIVHGKIRYKWPFSIDMLNYQRVPYCLCPHGLTKYIYIYIHIRQAAKNISGLGDNPQASGIPYEWVQQCHKPPIKLMENFYYPTHLVMTGGWLFILVGGVPTPLKNMKVSWDDDIPN